MNEWMKSSQVRVDPEVLEETALAMAQATIQNAINQTDINRAELARKMNRPRSFVSRMLSGRHNLTIKTMARALAACGLEVRFSTTPVEWNWDTQMEMPLGEQDPCPQAGSTMPGAAYATGIVVSA